MKVNRKLYRDLEVRDIMRDMIKARFNSEDRDYSLRRLLRERLQHNIKLPVYLTGLIFSPIMAAAGGAHYGQGHVGVIVSSFSLFSLSLFGLYQQLRQNNSHPLAYELKRDIARVVEARKDFAEGRIPCGEGLENSILDNVL